jgi:hypothetical protein
MEMSAWASAGAGPGNAETNTVSTIFRRDSKLHGWLRNAAAAAALALAAQAAQAVTITAVSASLNVGNSANLFNDFPTTSELRQSSVAVLSSSATAFSTRYAMVVGTDLGNVPASLPSLTVNHTASYTITLSISAFAIEVWQLDVLSSWAGALTLINDGTGPAAVTLSAVTGTRGGLGSLTSGSLNLADVTDLSGNGGGNTPFSQNQAAVIQGSGSGTVTLTFTWTASSTSTRAGGAGTNRGDEGGLRMGIDTAMSSYTADNYPGVGGRVIANDGHFVSALITRLVPEAPPLALVVVGLGGLLGLGRGRRASG